jgi:hypothetical protein
MISLVDSFYNGEAFLSVDIICSVWEADRAAVSAFPSRCSSNPERSPARSSIADNAHDSRIRSCHSNLLLEAHL